VSLSGFSSFARTSHDAFECENLGETDMCLLRIPVKPALGDKDGEGFGPGGGGGSSPQRSGYTKSHAAATCAAILQSSPISASPVRSKGGGGGGGGSGSVGFSPSPPAAGAAGAAASSSASGSPFTCASAASSGGASGTSVRLERPFALNCRLP
jgi:hypothetical protein